VACKPLYTGKVTVATLDSIEPVLAGSNAIWSVVGLTTPVVRFRTPSSSGDLAVRALGSKVVKAKVVAGALPPVVNVNWSVTE
jgi:hypothetical protein